MRAQFGSNLGVDAIRTIVLVVCTSIPAAGQTIWHVNQAAVGANDGTSWTDAFTDLHEALAVSVLGDELWIAEGTYKPDRGTGDRITSYRVPAGMSLFGGFAGVEECLDERDWRTHQTILSGDLNGDDGPRDCAEVSDCCREHDAPGCDDAECQAMVCGILSECCLDIETEFPDWDDRQCARLARDVCCHLGNWRTCENSMTLLDIALGDVRTTIDGLIIERSFFNFATDWQSSDDYGAVRSVRGITEGASLAVRSSLIRENVPGILVPMDVSVVDSEFSGNVGVDVSGDRLELRRTHMHDSGGSGANSFLAIEDCLFERNSASPYSSGGGVIRNSRFESSGYPISFGNGYSEITDCFFLQTPGVLLGFHSTAVIERCRFVDATGTSLQGTISNAWVRDSIFVGNRTVNSPVYFTVDSYLGMQNCTFLGNGSYESPLPFALTLYGTGSHADVSNCIFQASPTDIYDPEYYMLRVTSGATMDINYSIVEGWSGRWGGVGNSGVDPLFVDPDGADDVPGTEDDDLRLSPDSPAINAGDPDFVAVANETDLDGHMRVLCEGVDIGAYEMGIGDYDCNRTVDLTDFAEWQGCMTGPRNPVASARGSDLQSTIGCAAFDFNANGAIDLFDFAAFQPILSGQ